MRRRTFLKLIGGGTLAAAGTTAVRARLVGLLPSDPRPFRLWTEPTTAAGHRDLVTAAVLAANPHNSQTWKFHVDGDSIDVFIDRLRALGPVDPFLRQMHLGAGCAVENLCVASRGKGLSAAVVLLPDVLRPDLVARVTLAAGGTVDERLADAIRRRHTNRGPYDRRRRLPDDVADSLRGLPASEAARLILFEAGSEQGAQFARSTVTATETLIADAAFMEATDRWFRWTPAEISDNPDGPSLRCGGLSPGMELAAELGPRQGPAAFHASWLASTRHVHLATAPAFGVIGVPDAGNRCQLIEAGRLWQRFHLAATLHGLGAQPLDQILEAAERTRDLAAGPTPPVPATLAPAGCQAVLMFRVGYPTRAARASARRPLAEVLV